MATTFKGTLSIQAIGDYVKDADLLNVLAALNHGFASTYENGTGTDQANILFVDTRTLAAASESFDLNALTDVYGDVRNCTNIKVLYIRNKSVTAGENFAITGNWLPAFLTGTGPGFFVYPKAYALFNFSRGVAVVNVTSDTLTISNVAAAATFDYDIIIIGGGA